MGLPEKHYFTIDDLAERWGRNKAYVEYLLETRKPDGERILNAVYQEIKDPPGQVYCLTPSGKDQVMRLLDHDFPPGELAPLGEIIIMQEEVERFELEHGLIENNGDESEQAHKEIDQRKKAYEITSTNYFYREGNGWRIGFQGEKATFTDCKYIHYIVYLLEKQGKSIEAIHLVQATDYDPDDHKNYISTEQAFDEGLSTGHTRRDSEISDKKVREVEKLLYEIKAEPDPLVKAELQEQYDQEIGKVTATNSLVDENGENVYPAKRQRLDDPQRKQAQKAVRKGLDNAYSAFRKARLKKLAEHLRENIKTGGYYDFSYRDVDTSWDIKS